MSESLVSLADDKSKKASEGHKKLSDMKEQFKLLSWNIDGLDRHELSTRTHSIIKAIEQEKPDAVFLQEVIPDTLTLLQTYLPGYDSYSGGDVGYFVVILIRKDKLHVYDYEILNYVGSTMGRNLLVVHTIHQNSIAIDLMTSHLESCAAETSSIQRKEQLRFCFEKMKAAPPNRIVLFGGDLNLRDRELMSIGNIPTGIYDLWIATGSREHCRYTWDMQLNTNKDFSGNAFKPRQRFDRIYFRRAEHDKIKFELVDFDFKGIEKISSIQYFCSDHWAIQVCFDILSS